MKIQDNCIIVVRIENVNRQGKNNVLGSAKEETHTFYYRDRNRRSRKRKEILI